MNLWTLLKFELDSLIPHSEPLSIHISNQTCLCGYTCMDICALIWFCIFYIRSQTKCCENLSRAFVVKKIFAHQFCISFFVSVCYHLVIPKSLVNIIRTMPISIVNIKISFMIVNNWTRHLLFWHDKWNLSSSSLRSNIV